MNKTKALFLHEMRTMRWILLVGFVCVLGFCCILHNEVYWSEISGGFSYLDGIWRIEYETVQSAGSYFSAALVNALRKGHFVSIFAFAVLVTIQFGDFHNKINQEFFQSLSFSRTQRVFVKIISGYGVISICCLMLGIGVFLIRSKFIEQIYKLNLLMPTYKELLANETVWHTLRTLLFTWIVLLALYSIYVLIHNVANHNIVACVLSVVIMFMSIEYWLVEEYICDFFTNPTVEVSESFLRLINVFWGMLTSRDASFMEDADYQFRIGNYNYLTLVSYDSYLIPTIFVIGILVLSFFLVILVNKKRDMAREGMLISNKVARSVISALLAIAIALYLATCFGAEITIKIYVILSVIYAVLLFLLFMKIWKRMVK